MYSDLLIINCEAKIRFIWMQTAIKKIDPLEGDADKEVCP